MLFFKVILLFTFPRTVQRVPFYPHPCQLFLIFFYDSHSSTWSFPMSQHFAIGRQSIGVSASTTVIPMNIPG